MCNINKENDCWELELPIIMDFNQQLITLRIYPKENCYYISTLDTFFDEYDEYAASLCEEYYDLFISNDNHQHYGIKRDGAILYKVYDCDFSARAAVDEFVKFLVYLNDYILYY